MFLKLQISIIILLSCFVSQEGVQALEDRATLEEQERWLEWVNSNWRYLGREQEIKENRIRRQKLYRTWRKLLSAVEDGDVEKAEPYLKTGINVNRNIGSVWDKKVLLNKVTTPEMARLLIKYGADPNPEDQKGNSNFLLRDLFYRNRRVPIEDFHEIVRVFVDAGVDLGVNDYGSNDYGANLLHLVREDDLETAKVLKEYGVNLSAKRYESFGELAPVVRKFPSLLIEENLKSSCTYITEPSQIQAAQCGGRNVCMAEVSCIFEVGIDSNKTQIGRTFQAVCSSLPDGQCPEANDCVLDRSVVEATTAETENSPPSTSSSAVPKPSSEGGGTGSIR